MADETRRTIIDINVNETNAKKAEDALKRQQQETQKTIQSYARLAEQAEKLRSVGLTFAGLGTAMVAPFVAAASTYASRFKGLESAANQYNAALQKQADATSSLGRVAAQALIPQMNQIASIMSKIAAFAQAHPELVKAGVNLGAVLVAGGGAIAAVGQVQQTLARIQLIASQGGLAGSLVQSVVIIGAFAAGLKGGELVVREFGKATGDSRLQAFQLSDALKTLREAVGTVVLVATAVFEKAKVTAEQLAGSIVGITQLIRTGVEDTVDQIATGIRKFAIDIQGFVDGVRKGFDDMIGKIRDGFIDVINGLISAVNNILSKFGIQGISAVSKPGSSAQGGGVGFSGPTPEEQKAAEDSAYQQRKAARDLQNRIVGNALAQRDQGQRDSAISTLRTRADEVANFVNTGNLGGAVNNVVDFVKNLVGGVKAKIEGAPEAGRGVAGGGQSPEAVNAFIAYRKQQAEGERQYAKQLSEAQRGYDREVAQARINLARQLADGQKEKDRQLADAAYKFANDNRDRLLKFQNDTADAEKKRAFDRQKTIADFYRSEAETDKKAALERIQRQRENAAELAGLAANRDVAGYIEAQKRQQLEQQQQNTSDSEERKQRLAAFQQQLADEDKQYQFEQGQRKVQFDRENTLADEQYKRELEGIQTQADRKAEDLQRQFDRESEDRAKAYQQQLADLKAQHDAEKTERDRAFAEQLASLSGNIAGLKGIQDAYYADASNGLQAFVDGNRARLQQLYADAIGIGQQALNKINAMGPVYTGGGGQPSGNVARQLAALLPSHATGLASVPYDGYTARLHKGERIVPANQNMPNITVNMTVGDIATGQTVRAEVSKLSDAIKAVWSSH